MMVIDRWSILSSAVFLSIPRDNSSDGSGVLTDAQSLIATEKVLELLQHVISKIVQLDCPLKTLVTHLGLPMLLSISVALCGT